MSELPTVGLDPEWIAEHIMVDGARPRAAEFAGFDRFDICCQRCASQCVSRLPAT